MVSNGYSPGPPDHCGYGSADSFKEEPGFGYYFVYSSPEMIDIMSSGQLYDIWSRVSNLVTDRAVA
jgi:hypothetical protein